MNPRYPAEWPYMTREQKREWRLDRWRGSIDGIAFVGPEAEERYRAKVERLIKVYNVEEPDRLPVFVVPNLLPLAQGGIDYYTSIHHPEEALAACATFNEEFSADLECFAPLPFLCMPARAADILDHRLWAYAGHGARRETVGIQFIEGEYMLAHEYDALIRDPSDFWLRTFLPRAYGALEPLQRLAPLTDITMMPEMHLASLAQPDILASLEKLVEAGREMARHFETIGPYQGLGEAHGYFFEAPHAFARAPFDTLGDSLRGTRGILTDMHRQPGKLLEALEVIVDVTIHSVLASPRTPEAVIVFFPLHKGADGWMSREQFLTFYWPWLRKVMNALIEEGLIIGLYAEGSYESRLELVDDFPKGTVHWWFDRIDLPRAKKILGHKYSLQGNVPCSLLATGTPAEVTEACARLIEACAPGGGYILSPGAFPDFPPIENLRAMIRAGRESGIYQHQKAGLAS